MSALNETHNPMLHSWIASANEEGTDFPIQNLPFGVFRRASSMEDFRVGVAIGNTILDVSAAHAGGVFTETAAAPALACCASTLNAFMALGSPAWSSLRMALSCALREGSGTQAILQNCLLPQAQAEYALPAHIGDYTDFYTSIHHATNVGKLLRPDNPLMPNYQWVPIGYHGRSSSIGVSGQSFHRPLGQTIALGATKPVLGPSKRVDYELEVGVFMGTGNVLGEPIALDDADHHVFGLCLFNDWSARDIQGWEYQPLGPFLSKNFATTVSPWVVTMEALAPYRSAWLRPTDHPQPLPYLDSRLLRESGALNIALEVWIETAIMRVRGIAPHRLSASNFRQAYWSISQMVAHHTVNGCNLCPGDLLGSGTQSGPLPEETGALIELTQGGKHAIALPDGEIRTFLEDGDRVVFKGFCQREGAVRIGFGEVSGTLLPARTVA